MIKQFQSWLSYEADAGHRALEMIASVPAENRGLPQYQKALDKLAHTLAARALWLRRLGYDEPFMDKLFPTGMSQQQLTGLMPQVYSTWTAWLAVRTDDDLAEKLEYQSMEGDRFSNRMEEILIQLHGHALYHRGQVATLVDQCGGTVVDTDLIYATRRAVQSSPREPD